MNEMPYVNMYMNPNELPNINIFKTLDRLNNRLNRLEKQVRILENRMNNLNNNQFTKNEFDDNDNMYIL